MFPEQSLSLLLDDLPADCLSSLLLHPLFNLCLLLSLELSPSLLNQLLNCTTMLCVCVCVCVCVYVLNRPVQ